VAAPTHQDDAGDAIVTPLTGSRIAWSDESRKREEKSAIHHTQKMPSTIEHAGIGRRRLNLLDYVTWHRRRHRQLMVRCAGSTRSGRGHVLRLMSSSKARSPLVGEQHENLA